MNKLKIAVLSARFYPLLGGTERQALLLAQRLRKMGVELFVVTARLPGLQSQETINNIPVYRTLSFFRGRIGSFLFMVSSFVFLYSQRKFFDLIQVYLAGSPALVAILLGKLLRKKVLVKFGGAGPTGDLGTSSRRFAGTWKIGFLRKHIDVFVVPSLAIKQELLQAGFPAEKIKLIPNGVDTELFQPVNESAKIALRNALRLPNGNMVIYTGRLEPGKGLEILLDSWTEVQRQCLQAQLIIVGDGSLKQKLMDIKKSSNSYSNVYFIEKTDEVFRYVQAADIFVLSSLAEGISNALLEAMACGLAVVATNIGGTREIVIDNENGVLVEPADKVELSQTMSFLLLSESERERLGRYARRTIEENYRIELVARRYVEMYVTLLGKE